jgi:uncharacterized protein (DUF305 family)
MKSPFLRLSLVLCAALAAPLAVPAQTTDHTAHQGQAMTGEESPAARAFAEANTRMHADMAISFSDDVDSDFIRGMLPHHQGAVDMARIVLQYGTDPEVRALAEGIIAAQESEIAWMQDWLAKRSK